MNRLVFLLLLCAFGLQAQTYQLSDSLKLDAERFIGYDGYGHLYTIKQGALHKTGDLGEFFYQEFQLGPIESVDLINPLNLVVYFREVNTVVFLDNRLNEIERINFNTEGLANTAAVTNAGNNRLWVFDIDNQQLQLYDYRSKRSTLFSQPFSGIPLDMVSDFNDCFVLTQNKLRQINIYGSLLSEVDVDGGSKLSRNGKTLLMQQGNGLAERAENQWKAAEIELGKIAIQDLQLTQELLYIYDGITLYSFSNKQPKQ